MTRFSFSNARPADIDTEDNAIIVSVKLGDNLYEDGVIVSDGFVALEGALGMDLDRALVALEDAWESRIDADGDDDNGDGDLRRDLLAGACGYVKKHSAAL